MMRLCSFLAMVCICLIVIGACIFIIVVAIMKGETKDVSAILMSIAGIIGSLGTIILYKGIQSFSETNVKKDDK
jgi:hypothetical protein